MPNSRTELLLLGHIALLLHGHALLLMGHVTFLLMGHITLLLLGQMALLLRLCHMPLLLLLRQMAQQRTTTGCSLV